MINFVKPIAFEWDKGNIDKNVIKHNITNKESEEVFFTDTKIFYEAKHSINEKRYLLLGKTNAGRALSVVFTMRENKVRIISVRDMNKKERIHYEEQIKTNS